MLPSGSNLRYSFHYQQIDWNSKEIVSLIGGISKPHILEYRNALMLGQKPKIRLDWRSVIYVSNGNRSSIMLLVFWCMWCQKSMDINSTNFDIYGWCSSKTNSI